MSLKKSLLLISAILHFGCLIQRKALLKGSGFWWILWTGENPILIYNRRPRFCQGSFITSSNAKTCKYNWCAHQFFIVREHIIGISFLEVAVCQFYGLSIFMSN